MIKLSFCAVLFLMVCSQVYCKKKNNIIVLDDSNWRDCLKGQWMIKFYAPWCPACRSNDKDYKAFSEWSDDLDIKVAMVNIEKQPGLSGRFMVTALPTFYHAVDGEFRRYVGDRSSDAMQDFVENQVYNNLDPVMWLRHPDSVFMGFMSLLFKSSVIMKDMHESLTMKFGLQVWMSYTVFALLTVATGLFLGMILVCVMDYIAPPKRAKSSSSSTLQEPEVSSSTTNAGGENEEGGEEEEKEEEVEEVKPDDQEDDENHSQTSSQASQSWETITERDVTEAAAQPSASAGEIPTTESADHVMRQRRAVIGQIEIDDASSQEVAQEEPVAEEGISHAKDE